VDEAYMESVDSMLAIQSRWHDGRPQGDHLQSKLLSPDVTYQRS